MNKDANSPFNCSSNSSIGYFEAYGIDFVTIFMIVVISTLTLPSLAGAYTSYVAENTGPYDSTFFDSGAIIEVEPLTGDQHLVASGSLIAKPIGIALGIDNMLYVVQANRTVIRINRATGAQYPVSTDGYLQTPSAIAAAADGNLYVTDRQSASLGDGVVVRVDPISGVQSLVASGGHLVDPMGIAVDYGGDLLVTDTDWGNRGGAVIRILPTTGSQAIVSSEPFRAALGIAIAAAGDIFITGASSKDEIAVFRVDRSSGGLSLLSSSGFLLWPLGLVVEPSGSLLISDIDARIGANEGAILRVDPMSGTQSVVSYAGHFAGPWGIALAPDIPTSTTHSTWGSIKARYR